MSFTPGTKIVRSDSILGSVVAQEAVLMDIENGSYHGLDKVGSAIWEMSENPIQVDEIVNALMAKYDVTKDQCQSEVLAFLSDLQSRNIIRTLEDPQ